MSATKADEIRARQYAAKWRADKHAEEPTDVAFDNAFARCVQPAKPELYPLIREEIATWDARIRSEQGA